MSAFWPLGQSTTAPMATATAHAARIATTIFAASGPSGDGPFSECECEWECATRTE